MQVIEYIIDLIGKLVCYAVYYKYIIDLTAVNYKQVSMLCSLLQLHYWFNW